MARDDHPPIDRAAFDLAVHLEKLVRQFSRYHKYALGTEWRSGLRVAWIGETGRRLGTIAEGVLHCRWT